MSCKRDSESALPYQLFPSELPSLKINSAYEMPKPKTFPMKGRLTKKNSTITVLSAETLVTNPEMVTCFPVLDF